MRKEAAAIRRLRARTRRRHKNKHFNKMFNYCIYNQCYLKFILNEGKNKWAEETTHRSRGGDRRRKSAKEGERERGKGRDREREPPKPKVKVRPTARAIARMWRCQFVSVSDVTSRPVLEIFILFLKTSVGAILRSLGVTGNLLAGRIHVVSLS